MLLARSWLPLYTLHFPRKKQALIYFGLMLFDGDWGEIDRQRGKAARKDPQALNKAKNKRKNGVR